MRSPGGSRVRIALLLGAALTALAVLLAARAVAHWRGQLGPQGHLLDGRTFDFSFVLGVFVGTVAVALVAQSWALSPIRKIAQTARVMRSDLRARTRLRGSDDVALMGQALDELATELAREKASLEEDRNRLMAILDSMAEGVLVTGREPNLSARVTKEDSQGVIVLANAALREMLLLDRGILGRPPMEAIRLSGLDEILIRGASAPAGASGELELGGLRPRRLLVRAAPIRGEGSAGLVAVFNDVTELRRLENVRRDFVANVSHELRTPIAAVSSAAETLLLGAMHDPDAVREFLGIIDRHASRLKDLVDDLLELSRLESKEWRLTMEPVEAKLAANAALEAVALAAARKNVALSDQVPAELPCVAVDRRAIEQVLVNLLDNAIKYGGQRGPVTLSASVDGRHVLFEVRDQGLGIEPRHLPRLFERFYRVDAGRSRAVGGTGLGLSIVKHLVEAMGGRVDVTSTLGVGTVFRVTVMVADAPTLTTMREQERQQSKTLEGLSRGETTG